MFTRGEVHEYNSWYYSSMNLQIFQKKQKSFGAKVCTQKITLITVIVTTATNFMASSDFM